jgi:glycosyltransferase involved in cell wall biosynthesis
LKTAVAVVPRRICRTENINIAADRLRSGALTGRAASWNALNEKSAMRISIITPSFNQAAFLTRTARSILSQSGAFDLQWIVIDGESTDGTKDLLSSLHDARLTWVSEPDRGQSHAINKGLAMADGDVVAWLNSDDLYKPGALGAVASAFSRQPGARWLVGRYEVIDAGDRVIRNSIVRYKDRGLRRYHYRKLLRENFISQPSVFWRRDFGREIGPLDESLHWTMDYDLWLRMGSRCDPLILSDVLSQFRLHAQSKSGRVERGQFDEQYQVASRFFANDHLSRFIHRFNVEKIVLAYRTMRALRLG